MSISPRDMRVRHPFMAAALLWLLPTLFGAVTAVAQDTGVRKALLRVLVSDINDIDSVAQRFEADIYADLEWHDAGLAHTGSDSVSVDLDDIWYPHLLILNEQRVVRTLPRRAEVKPNGDVIYRQRFWGTFSQPLQLTRFPFDTQTLQLTFINLHYGEFDVDLVVSPDSRMFEDMSIADWSILDWRFEAADLPLGAQRGENRPAAVFSIEVERHASYFTLKVILPLILIVAMSWLVFWIDPSLSGTQISVSVTAMLTLIAYRFSIGGLVPRLSFLTTLDYFVLGSTVLVFLSLVEVVITSRFANSGRIGTARAIDRAARWVAPLLYLLMILAVFG